MKTPRQVATPPETPTELVVFSHLRWNFVWQRPQHILSRLARDFTTTTFIEEPLANDTVGRATVRRQRSGAVDRVWLDVPGPARHVGFDDPAAATYAGSIRDRLDARPAERTLWLYTPLALDLIDGIDADLIVYDVMDDLASFKHASTALRDRHRRLLDRADVVFTGGHSLHRSVRDVRPDAVCFPSGVEADHFRPARQLRHATARPRPVAGYVGVIDERLDLALIADLARMLPDWDVHLVGPVVKIDPATLPEVPNLCFTGPRDYGDLAVVMAGFDVALMPFALNEATRSISPTKSLEYLAAGLPVVSTRVPDVVTSLAEMVTLADDGASFAAACRRYLDHGNVPEQQAARPLIRWNSWDAVTERMRAYLRPVAVPLLTEEATS